jgi:hypothetical protein
MQEGSTPPEWDATNRILGVGLPKASVAVVNLSSYLSAGDLSIMALWGWIRELYESDETFWMTEAGADLQVPRTSDLLALLTRLVTEGGHEMITPARTLTLVHAVQQPIGRPTFQPNFRVRTEKLLYADYGMADSGFACGGVARRDADPCEQHVQDRFAGNLDGGGGQPVSARPDQYDPKRSRRNNPTGRA